MLGLILGIGDPLAAFLALALFVGALFSIPLGVITLSLREQWRIHQSRTRTQTGGSGGLVNLETKPDTV